MAVLGVLHFPHPNLRKKATPVDSIDASITKLAEDMLETMYDEGGIGLAATQVDVQKRLVVMDLSEDRNEGLILINPEITFSEGEEESQEGCLSVPGFYENVMRADKIHCRYLDVEGVQKELQAEGLLAVCIQHEIDHLDGKLFIDYLSPLKRQYIQKKIKKQDRQPLQQAL
jgi:peptide deformylase